MYSNMVGQSYKMIETRLSDHNLLLRTVQIGRGLVRRFRCVFNRKKLSHNLKRAYELCENASLMGDTRGFLNMYDPKRDSIKRNLWRKVPAESNLHALAQFSKTGLSGLTAKTNRTMESLILSCELMNQGYPLFK